MSAVGQPYDATRTVFIVVFCVATGWLTTATASSVLSDLGKRFLPARTAFEVVFKVSGPSGGGRLYEGLFDGLFRGRGVSVGGWHHAAQPRHLISPVKITPTPLTAAIAGIVAAVAWPHLWARYGGPGSAGGVELVVATLLVIALPAHAFVVGFARPQPSTPGAVDTALLKRVGAWLAAAAVATVLRAAVFG